MKRILAYFITALYLGSALSNGFAYRNAQADFENWQVTGSPQKQTLTPSAELGAEIVAHYEWRENSSHKFVRVQIENQKSGRTLGEHTFQIRNNPTTAEQKALVAEFFKFWKSIGGYELLPEQQNHRGQEAFERLLRKLDPTPNANASFIAIGAGALLGMGFVAFIVGKGISSAGGNSDVMAGLDLIGGLIALGGAGAMLVGGGMIACDLFLK